MREVQLSDIQAGQKRAKIQHSLPLPMEGLHRASLSGSFKMSLELTNRTSEAYNRETLFSPLNTRWEGRKSK